MRKPQKNRFVIVFEGRTGSSYVVSSLNSHAKILCYPEIFTGQPPCRQNQMLDAVATGLAVENVDPSPRFAHYLQHYSPYSLDEKINLESVGFKVKLHQTYDLVQFLSNLEGHNFKLIYLKRKNIVKSVVSDLNAQRLRRKHRLYNAVYKHQVQGPLYVQKDIFLRALYKRVRVETAHEEFFEAYSREKKLFFYENLLEDQNSFFQCLLEYLDAETIDLQGKFIKNTADELSKAVQNYDEIRRLLFGTYFERFVMDK